MWRQINVQKDKLLNLSKSNQNSKSKKISSSTCLWSTPCERPLLCIFTWPTGLTSSTTIAVNLAYYFTITTASSKETVETKEENKSQTYKLIKTHNHNEPSECVSFSEISVSAWRFYRRDQLIEQHILKGKKEKVWMKGKHKKRFIIAFQWNDTPPRLLMSGENWPGW